MPFIVAHGLIPVMVVDFSKRYSRKLKKSVNRKNLAICGLAGIAPDFDIIFSFLVNLFIPLGNLHRTFTHSVFSVIPVLLLALALKRWRTPLLFAAIGWASHTALDVLLTGTVPLLYPLPYQFGLQILTDRITSTTILYVAGLDIAVLASWIFYKKLFFWPSPAAGKNQKQVSAKKVYSRNRR